MSPTGYTAALYEGEDQSFEDFAMQCARAFGALVTMRDEPRDAPIPDEFEPSSYHEEGLAEARRRLEAVRGWTDERVEAEARTVNEVALAHHESMMQERRERRARYEGMLAKVEEWDPPTSDHVGLKDFMRSQIEESIVFDCSEREPPETLSGAEYRARELTQAERDVEYHERHAREDRERAGKRTAWVKALRESLGAPSTLQ